MQTTPANLNLFFTTLETRFWTAFTIAQAWYQRLCTIYPVDSEDWASGWMDPTEPFREWTNQRRVQVIGLETYKVKMQLFEKTLGVDELKLRFDKQGLYYPIAAQIGQQAAKFPDYQVRDLLQGRGSQTGLRQNGTDGLTHWNTAHPIDIYDASKGTYCNDFRGGVTINGITVGGAFTTNGFNTLWQEFSSRKSPSGEALGIEPDLSMGPSQLKAAMVTVLQSQFYAPPQMGPLGSGSGANGSFVGAMENVLKGWTDLFINKDLQTDATSWWMFYVGGVIKPIAWLLNLSPDFVARTRPDDPNVFDNHQYMWGSKAIAAPAWGLPFLSAISGPS